MANETASVIAFGAFVRKIDPVRCYDVLEEKGIENGSGHLQCLLSGVLWRFLPLQPTASVFPGYHYIGECGRHLVWRGEYHRLNLHSTQQSHVAKTTLATLTELAAAAAFLRVDRQEYGTTPRGRCHLSSQQDHIPPCLAEQALVSRHPTAAALLRSNDRTVVL
jgi:hypothetical protein